MDRGESSQELNSMNLVPNAFLGAGRMQGLDSFGGALVQMRKITADVECLKLFQIGSFETKIRAL